MPGDAAPAFDSERGRFVEPYAPHETIGVMHLAGREQKEQIFSLARLDGRTLTTGLRYRDTHTLRHAITAEHAEPIQQRAGGAGSPAVDSGAPR
jgi:hypothetical protein